MNPCNTRIEPAPTRELTEIINRPRFITREDESGVIFHIALPAVSREDLTLTLLESNLKIEAKRTDAVPEAWKTHRDTGSSCRHELNIRLTDRFDGARAKASLENGVLTLRVPLREESKPRQIAVN